MITGERVKTIFKLATPIITAMISLNLISLVDVYMVGKLGDTALAATTIGGFAGNLIMAPVLGFNSAVQAITGRRLGSDGVSDSLCFPLNGGMLWAVIIGIPLTVIAWFIVPTVAGILSKDAAVTDLAIPYMRYFLLGIMFTGVISAFQGFWNGIGRPIFYLGTILASHGINVLLNYMFIFGNWGAPELGVKGAGFSSLLAGIAAVLIYFTLGLIKLKGYGFLKGMPKPETLKSLIKLAVPVSIQSSSFNAGYVVFIWMIGSLGTAEVAAAGVIMTLSMVAILPGMGLGISAATLVSQSLGRQEKEAAAEWGWDACKMAVLVMALFGIPMAVVPDLILGIFLENPETIALGRGPLRLAGCTVGLLGISFTLMHSLLGAGDNRRVMMTSISWQWGFMLPLVYLVGPVLGHGLLQIWMVQVLYVMMLVMTYVLLWRGRRWQSIKV